jgi:AcrR family transcriptional regulator
MVSPGQRARREQERPEGGRRYHSALREARAAQTRRRITGAASDLFAQHGFAGTTVAAIAREAGVSPQTVYATFGSKGAIVGALLGQFEQDADVAGWRTRINEEPDAGRRLDLFAGWTAAMLGTSKKAILAARDALTDPTVVELQRLGDRHRRDALRALVSRLREEGDLRQGLAEEDAVDCAWILTGVAPYLSATDGCGWTDEQYASWLADLLRQQLLEPS